MKYTLTYSIFNKKCEFRGPETIIEGTLKDASGAQYMKVVSNSNGVMTITY